MGGCCGAISPPSVVCVSTKMLPPHVALSPCSNGFLQLPQLFPAAGHEVHDGQGVSHKPVHCRCLVPRRACWLLLCPLVESHNVRWVHIVQLALFFEEFFPSWMSIPST